MYTGFSIRAFLFVRRAARLFAGMQIASLIAHNLVIVFVCVEA